MEIEEFKRVGEDLFGNGWQTRMARALGIDGSTVRRWVGGSIPVPSQIVAYLELLADRQKIKGALILERQSLGKPEKVEVPQGQQLEWMKKKLVFPGVEQAKPMPAIRCFQGVDRLLLSLDGQTKDDIEVLDVSYVLTRHPDSMHLSGYLDAAARHGHVAAVVRHRFHHYSLIAHRDTKEEGSVLHQISTHMGQVRTLVSTTNTPEIAVETMLD